jgi:hypothetical protein
MSIFALLLEEWRTFGLVVGTAGFLGYSLRPEWIATLLGT